MRDNYFLYFDLIANSEDHTRKIIRILWKNCKTYALNSNRIQSIHLRFLIQNLRPYAKRRWPDGVFQGQYLPSLSINYVAINKNLKKITAKVVLDKDENLL